MKKYLNINTFLIGLVMVLAFGMYFWRTTHANQGGVAVVRLDGTEVRMEIRLDEDKIHEIHGGNLPVYLEVKDGAIRFINTVCPDHLCENEGFIRYEDETAICMPAGVAVLVTAEYQGGQDE